MLFHLLSFSRSEISVLLMSQPGTGHDPEFLTSTVRCCNPLIWYSYRLLCPPCGSFPYGFPAKYLKQFFANDQLDALFYIFIYYTSLHISSIIVLIIRRSNCINTSSGMISLCEWLLGVPVRTSLLTGTPSSHSHRLIIPDDVLIQFDLLMMSTMMLETCRKV